MSINSISSLYPADLDTGKTKGLEDGLNKDFSDATEEELMEVCRDFEAYFTEQVFKAMEKMVPESEEADSSTSQLTDFFKGEMTQQYAKDAAAGEGLGIAQMLFEQMKRNYDI